MRNVYIFLAEGFEEVEAITPIDVLRRAGANVTTVSIGLELYVTAAHDVHIKADTLLKNIDVNNADLLILPGGMPGTKNLSESTELASLLKDANAKGLLLAAICAAPSVFGGLGLLEEKKAVCYPGWEDTLKGAIIENNAVCHDGNIITSRGAGTAMDFSLYLVSILFSKQLADELAEKMMYVQ